MRFAFKIQVIGLENVPTDRGLIVACNHQTNYDPVFIGITIKREIRYMAKEELFKNRIIGWGIRKLGTFPVSRGKGDQTAILTSIDTVKQGVALGIFPEGGRSTDGKIRRPKSGASLIAYKTKCDVVPVGIKFVGKNLWRTKVQIIYGEPIKYEDLHIMDNSKNELRAASRVMMDKVADLIGIEHYKDEQDK